MPPQCVSSHAHGETNDAHSQIRNNTGTHMQTPNDHLRALLLERAHEAGLSDSAVARAHNRAYENSTLAPSTIQRFRESDPAPGTPPSQLMQEAYAAVLHTSIVALWREAIQRWEAEVSS